MYNIIVKPLELYTITSEKWNNKARLKECEIDADMIIIYKVLYSVI